ncbi:hypothetical protein ACFL6C_03810 [Myxococcota bacterium]
MKRLLRRPASEILEEVKPDDPAWEGLLHIEQQPQSPVTEAEVAATPLGRTFLTGRRLSEEG